MTPEVHVSFNGRDSPKDVCWFMLYVCGLSEFFTVVLQTREWELSPICSVCTHVESDWWTGREQ